MTILFFSYVLDLVTRIVFKSFTVTLSVLMLLSCLPVLGQTYETSYQIETGNNTSGKSNHTLSGTSNQNAIPGNVSEVDIHTLLDPSLQSKPVYAALMGWWGKGGAFGCHSGRCNVQYNSDDGAMGGQIDQQIDDLISRGYNGATIAWYGQGDFSDTVLAHWLARSAARGGTFKVVPRVNGDDLGSGVFSSSHCPSGDRQACAISQMQYIRDAYFGSSAYMHVGSQPLVTWFISPATCSSCNWNTIKSAVGSNVAITKKDKNGVSGTSTYVSGFDGGYTWNVAHADNSYLDDFFNNTKTNSTAIIWWDASKGFNDQLASWGTGTIVDQSCGQRWLNLWGYINSHWPAFASNLDAVLVPTWNDYEEGTEVETGIDNCIDPATPFTLSIVNSNQLQWTVNFTSTAGVSSTIDHYDLFYANSSDENELHKFASSTCSTTTCTASLAAVPSGTYHVYVKAVGKPHILNHMNTPAQAATYGNGTVQPYSYTPFLELPTTAWETLDDCGSTATCNTVEATSTYHSSPNAVQFLLGGNNPPGFQIGRWVQTVAGVPDTAGDFEYNVWVLLNQTAYTNAQGLIFEISNYNNNQWYHFEFKCDFSTAVWNIWDELGNAFHSTGVACSRPPAGVFTNYIFHMKRLSATQLQYVDMQVGGGPVATIDPGTGTFNTQSISNSNAIKVGIKLMGNAQMNDYTIYTDDLRLGYR
jgi:hypothetical protein